VTSSCKVLGEVPIASLVSCAPFMLDYGNRGVLLENALGKKTTNN
jgi:hypothetical protein